MAMTHLPRSAPDDKHRVAASTALYQFKPMLGPAEEFPVGSLEWAERISARLQTATRSVTRSTAHHLRDQLKAIWRAKPRPWEIWPKGRPFGTPDDYCRKVTGHSWETLVVTVKELTRDPGLDDLTEQRMRGALAEAQNEHRQPGRPSDEMRDNVTRLRGEDGNKGGGNGVDYLLRRLARDHQLIFDRYVDGEFRSVRAAAREAGIVKTLTAFEQIEKLIPKLSDAEKQQLREML